MADAVPSDPTRAPQFATPVYIVGGGIPVVSTGVPLGYEAIVDLSAAVPLTVPDGATLAIITVTGADIRYLDDGSTPTASEGMPVFAKQSFAYSVALDAIKFIQQMATGRLDVLYYGPSA